MYYTDFDLTIDSLTSEGYPVRGSAEPCGELRSLMSLDFGEDPLHRLVADMESLHTSMEQLSQLGNALYELLFTGEVHDGFQRCLGTIRQDRNHGLRIRLRINAPELAPLPWEAMYRLDTNSFMGASIHTPVVRYQEMPRAISDLSCPSPLRMLVTIPDTIPAYGEIDAQVEKRNLLESLKGLEKLVELNWLEGTVTWERLRDQLTENTYHCFHFIGHGEFRAGEGALVLHGPGGRAEYGDKRRMLSAFGNHPSMKLVVLNACHGATVSTSDVFSGLAPSLTAQGVPAVVAMKYAIEDNAAIHFSRTFYRCLFRGKEQGRVDVAMAQARARLAEEVSCARDFCAPVLYLRARHGVLFEKVTTATLANIPFTAKAQKNIQTVVDSYQDNQDLGDKAARAKLDHLAKLEKLGRQAKLMATTITLVLFFSSWVGLFDLAGLDTRVELFSLHIGEFMVDIPYHDEIVTVIAEKTIDKEWRTTHHPELLDRLSAAGASVIAFDLIFPEPSSHDDPFVAAITNARKRGTRIIAGTDGVRDGEPVIAPRIGHALSAPAATVCIGRKLQSTRSAPVAVLQSGPDAAAGQFLSLSFTAFALHRGYSLSPPPTLDLPHQQLLLTGDNLPFRPVPFSETNTARRTGRCGLISPGDTVCEMILLPVPLGALRNPRQHFSYADILHQPPEELKKNVQNKIVLVGAIQGDQFTENRLNYEIRSGVELHAEALNSLLNGVTIRALPGFYQLAFITTMAFCAVLIRIKTGIKRRAVLVVVTHLCFFGITVLLYAGYFRLINILYPLVAFWLSYAVVGKYHLRRPQ